MALKRTDFGGSEVAVKRAMWLDHSRCSKQSCMTLDPTRGSGRVRKFTGKSGSGRVQCGQKLKFNFTLKYLMVPSKEPCVALGSRQRPWTSSTRRRKYDLKATMTNGKD